MIVLNISTFLALSIDFVIVYEFDSRVWLLRCNTNLFILSVDFPPLVILFRRSRGLRKQAVRLVCALSFFFFVRLSSTITVVCM